MSGAQDTWEPSDDELREALVLKESVDLSTAKIQDDGTILVHLLRPCVGRGKGTRLYEADMLRENAHKLTGWKMYVDHQSDEARKKAGGLPRSVRDLGGRLIETWWDPEVPAEGRFGQGAVVGRSKPVPFIRELIDNDPQIVELSINSHATGTKPTIREGQRVFLVEGIADQGSVDWVTEAGAGGKVAALMESVYEGDDSEAAEETAVLESMTDDELRAYIEAQRPDLIEAKKPMNADEEEDAKDGGKDEGAEEDAELEALIQKFMKKGMSRPLATNAAKKELAAEDKSEGLKESPAPNNEGGDDVAEITAEALREALETDEGRDMVLGLVREVAAEDLRNLVESSLSDERDLIRREASAEARREIEIRDFRDDAHKRIAESKLPEQFQAKLRDQFAITESGPTPDLDQIDEVDDDGNVTKTASEKLAESVDAQIGEARSLVASLNPARVRGQGPVLSEGERKGNGEGEETSPYAPPPEVRELLQEAGFNDPDKVYEPVS